MLKLVFITWKTIQNTMTRLVKSTRSSYLSKSYSDVKQKNDMQFLWIISDIPGVICYS